MKGSTLSTRDWSRVVLVAGIGTILEWWDFYIYTQLNGTLKKVFFPTTDATAQALAYWGVFAAAFVVRPFGALLFGHIGDTLGRVKTMTLAIFCMAVATIIIGCLPTYNTGSYTANPPILAPVFLAIMRMLQGLAMGGEFASAAIYVSEMAGTSRRGTFVALLQNTVNIGMILATLVVMLLEHTVSAENMLIWGWRIPFLLAFLTAILGFVLRLGLPEPKAFLAAARAEKLLLAQNSAEGGGHPTASISPSGADTDLKDVPSVAKFDNIDSETFVEEKDAYQEEGALSKLHGHSHSKVPIFRLLSSNWAGLLIQIAYMAWVSGAFYTTVSWLPTELKKDGMAGIITQGILIVSLMFNAVGLLSVGIAFDRGMRAIRANTIIVVLGMGVGFGVFYGVWTSQTAAWCLICMMQLIIGAAMALVVLPCTRIYGPLERTTGFAFGYNTGYGIIGGLSPLIITSIKASLSEGLKVYAPCFWLMGLGILSLIGSALLRAYSPRLDKAFVGKIE